MAIEIGARFGKLVVTELAKAGTRHRKAKWMCRCDCGTYRVVRNDYLKSGRATSCGCAPSAWKRRPPRYETCGEAIATCEMSDWRASQRKADEAFQALLRAQGVPEGVKKASDDARVLRTISADPGSCRWASNIV